MTKFSSPSVKSSRPRAEAKPAASSPLTAAGNLSKLRYGFKGRKQLPLFMVWREHYDETGDVEFAYVVFNSWNWIGR